jgi:hypothetical protein
MQSLRRLRGIRSDWNLSASQQRNRRSVNVRTRVLLALAGVATPTPGGNWIGVVAVLPTRLVATRRSAALRLVFG